MTIQIVVLITYQCTLSNTSNHSSSKAYCNFKTSPSDVKFPDAWKSAYIHPIHKKGNRNKKIIASFLPKILDKIVADKISDTVIVHIPQEQHGFVKGKATQTNLLIVYLMITLIMLFQKVTK